MEKKFQDILDNLADLEPPKHLRQTVLARVLAERQKRELREKVFYRGGIFLCATLLIVFGTFFGREIIRSDFWSIASLAASDLGIVAGHWQEFFASLMETLPAASIAAVLAPLAGLLLLIRHHASRPLGHGFKNNMLTA